MSENEIVIELPIGAARTAKMGVLKAEQQETSDLNPELLRTAATRFDRAFEYEDFTETKLRFDLSQREASAAMTANASYAEYCRRNNIDEDPEEYQSVSNTINTQLVMKGVPIQ